MKEININDYSYTLPEHKIAQHPLSQRDEAKMLVYQQGQISHRVFKELDEHLHQGDLLVFNNTKVIPARLYFRRATGALIEIFLLQPDQPSVITVAMQQQGHCSWQCMIGNKKKWKNGETLERLIYLDGEELLLKATLTGTETNTVNLEWSPAHLRFVDVVQTFGELPLPPYLNREATADDQVQYQTVYSKREGAVAAPTAGLHFTNPLLERLKEKGVQQSYLTLHVSAGTFMPVKEANAVNHAMHSEQVVFTRANLQALLHRQGRLVAVGTTSMRALESLYWFGVQLLQDRNNTIFKVRKLQPYQLEPHMQPATHEALQAVYDMMLEHNLEEIMGETEIFIFPDYSFKLCDGLITNYHLPGTTLLLLVAAFIGPDWQKVYQEALDNEYRFLSFGDSSLLWRS
jgi:S-adenosylmethionine:tRNA ribosyltransferase-isomerase